jgi:TonB-linked SusC/RagA family outer membrane protein
MKKKLVICEWQRIFPLVNWVKFLVVFCLIVGTANAYTGDNSVTQSSPVTGKVTDGKTKEDLIGVTVLVKGTQIGAVTDVDGTYSINVPNKTAATLVFSYLGYGAKEISVNNQSVIDVALEPSSHELSEVVVTALGIKKEAKALGYAISSINADELMKTSAPNLGSALYGKAAGVRIQTSPGGIQGAISINIRGLNSLTQTNQPLIIVDGIPIHNGEANLAGYWDNQRIQSNGLADLNPDDIESLSVLKGAAASALYGSEAANGVVMITTKSGKASPGLGVDFSASLTWDPIAYMPEYQTKYGTGIPAPDRTAYGDQPDGWGSWTDRNGNTYRRNRPTTLYFGPKYDGQDVLYYDGTLRKYSPINNQPWSEVYRTGFTQQYNLAVANATEKSNFRFSYTYVDNLPTQYNSTFNKNNFNLAGSYNVTKNIKLDYGATYLVQSVKNPPYRLSRVLTNTGGMFGAFDDVKYLRETTRTSLGYENQVYTATSQLTPKEGYEWTPRCYALVDEYFWNILANEYDDNTNRLIANITPSWEIIKGLTLKGRLATDYTTEKIENKSAVRQSIVFDTNQGSYSTSNNRYSIIYGDVLLSYDTKLTDQLGLNATVGWQGRTEEGYNVSANTNSGLSIENWFNLKASNGALSASQTINRYLKEAFLGELDLSYNSWAYLTGTLRRETSSTLPSDRNIYYYPSVSGSFIYTELFKNQLPSWYDYGKFRVSYGVVGNPPGLYSAYQGYIQNTVGGKWIYNVLDGSLGNDLIKNEVKYEWEFGLDSKFLKNRLGFELTYYTNKVSNQILRATMPSSSGGSSMLLNVGDLSNKGIEFSIYGTPVQTHDWRWDLRGNIAWNRNKVVSLMDGLNQLEHHNWDNGSAFLYSKVGQPAGDIYALAPKQDANGNYIIREDGYYQLTDSMVKVGNAQPKVVGGFATTLTYKNFSFDISFDYRIGGAVMNRPYQFMMGQGAIKESLKYHDGEGAGLTYYVDGNYNVIPYTGTQGPKGERIYDNGIILKGVTVNGQPNTKMIGGDEYLWYTYNWGGYDPTDVTYYSHGVFDNTYVKCRELSISYNLPRTILSKAKCKSLQLSVFGRNLFYLYKNLPMLDAECADGTNWITQTDIGGSAATTRSIGVSLRASF